MIHDIRRVQKDPPYLTVELQFGSTTIDLGCLSETELEFLVKDFQAVIEEITRKKVL